MVRNAAPDLAPVVMVQTAQIGSNSINKQGHKSYKFIMNKHCCRLGCDCLHGKGTLGIDIVLHRENLKFVGGQQSQEDESSQVEIVLRSFSIGIESHFMAQWQKKSVTMKVKEIKNYMEDWEREVVKTNE